MIDKLTLYHLTASSNLTSIFEHGLLPQVGHHCKQIKDSTFAIVFLCKKEDIQFWKNCFKDVDVVIEIDCAELYNHEGALKKRRLDNAPSGFEYGSIEPIPSEYFKTIIKIKKDGETK